MLVSMCIEFVLYAGRILTIVACLLLCCQQRISLLKNGTALGVRDVCESEMIQTRN